MSQTLYRSDGFPLIFAIGWLEIQKTVKICVIFGSYLLNNLG